ncbi:MAG: sodium:calcium antiporter [Azonexus sp.]|nr:sodium:calcium antiporter [Azonexus sp.]
MDFAARDLMYLLGAVLLAAAGGEAFLKAILGAAAHLRVPRALAATTLAAFATSSPELTVSTVAALSGNPEIGLGNALGSNVVNIAFIFGLALLFGAIRSARKDFGRDFLLALTVPLLTLAFALDGRIGRGEGALLIALFVVWLVVVVRMALRHRDAVADTPPPYAGPGPWLTLTLGILGFGALVAAGRLFVQGAAGLAVALEIDTYIVGVLLVSIGTTMPELVTVLLSRLRGHDDIGVGTLIGSNIFNGLAIVGLASVIHPIAVPAAEIALTLVGGTAALLLLPPDHRGLIPRWRGPLLLLLYGGFVWATLTAN